MNVFYFAIILLVKEMLVFNYFTMKQIIAVLAGLLLPLSFSIYGQTTMSKSYQYTVNGVSFSMVEVPEGTYTMGATSEQGCDNLAEAKPTHRVSLDKYQIGQTEVTQSLWQAVMGSNPSKVKGDRLPVTNISWNDCQSFIVKLNALTGKTFRLPTEAEWEYAARGGQNSRRYTYSGSNNIHAVAWHCTNSENKVWPVASKKANELGIYDLCGNVSEWCDDWFGNYESSSQSNPHGVETGEYRVVRGGGYADTPNKCRVSYRQHQPTTFSDAGLGFRLVLE